MGFPVTQNRESVRHVYHSTILAPILFKERLFLLVADTNREQRILSIFLAVLTQAPDLAHEILGTIGVRVGKRTKITAFTEVTLKTKVEDVGRPDALIIVTSGRSTWTALIEAKIGRSNLDTAHIERYLKLARDNGIQAVITVSNDFVARPDHSPIAGSTQIIKKLSRNVALYHWSWTSLATCCDVLANQDHNQSPEQIYLVNQLSLYFRHPTTGMERFTQMGPQWKDIVQLASSGVPLTKNTPGLEEVVASWFAEERDLSLHMTSNLNRPIRLKIDRKHEGTQSTVSKMESLLSSRRRHLHQQSVSRIALSTSLFVQISRVGTLLYP